jgi:twitching motility protein PilT
MQTNRKLGMITMDEAILQLYQNQVITKDVALQFAQDPDAMAMKL